MARSPPNAGPAHGARDGGGDGGDASTHTTAAGFATGTRPVSPPRLKCASGTPERWPWKRTALQ